ncbi:serine O-acetyltransferase [Bradymonadaceae bacterium TMQ3]|uniref:serine O-acetyltransferase n=1 Tax=Lujinxingia sediminis TaxID=2480984 RepID=A0ABY0CPZ2_9DELT|nr:serine O-acetyltransferase [Lujinxingia sediminis]RDV38385.1 serine O-acetyltransferase [Bradymonadaceae bacterium TMQ3]RVU42545.1 serine O-acetyltransferase [Lujinxingia sediminis]TXC76844.1 serine O-acetyltransferase [Bradymonadales bacterium TMQ1]
MKLRRPNPQLSASPPGQERRGVLGFFKDAIEDIQAVRRGDPAARTLTEVVTTYPGLHALWMHRLSHRLWIRGHHLGARMLSHYGRHLTGVEIHPGAVIGRRVFIDHGMGVVIGETSVVGDDCLIYKGVVLGGTSLKRTKRHPTIGKGVTIGSNACILGAVTIGDGARVGSGSVVVKDVEACATVVGIPGRVVSREQRKSVGPPDLDHDRLPDPIQRIVRDLLDHIDSLSNRLHILEQVVDLSPEELAEKLERHELQDALEQEFLNAYQDDDVEEGTKPAG